MRECAKIVWMFVALLVLLACSNTDSALEKKWQLIQYQYADGHVKKEGRVFYNFQKGSFSAICIVEDGAYQTFFGTYSLKGDEISIILLPESVGENYYDDFLALGKRMSEGIWQKAGMAVQVARQYGLSVSWYAKWMQANTLREKYNRGYWLQFYLYKDLENLFVRQQDTDRLRLLNQAYFSGDWSLIAKKGAEGFYFFSQDDLASMRQAAKTRWGKKIVAELEKKK